MTLGSDRPLVEPMVNVELVQDELDLGSGRNIKEKRRMKTKKKKKRMMRRR